MKKKPSVSRPGEVWIFSETTVQYNMDTKKEDKKINTRAYQHVATYQKNSLKQD